MCVRWTIKKAECQRIDAFKLWYLKRLLRVSCTARRSNQSILKEISPIYSLEGLMLKLKLQYSGHLMQRADSLEKTLMLGKIEGRRGWQRMRRLDGITEFEQVDMSLIKLREIVKDREACHAAVHGVTKSQTRLSNWTTMDCSPPGSSVHGISQARILGWVAIPSSRVSFQPKDWYHIVISFCLSQIPNLSFSYQPKILLPDKRSKQRRRAGFCYFLIPGQGTRSHMPQL